jgi:hypothetical protein
LLASAVFADSDLRLPRIVVADGGPYICRGLAIQKFYDKIEISGDYLFQPLSMLCTNGSETAPGDDWVRVFLLPDKTDQDLVQYDQPSGRLLIDEKSFLANSQIFLDLTRQLKPGLNKLFIEAAGPVGAQFQWEIRSIGAPHLYMPDTVSAMAGSWLTVNGSGFSLRAQENTVELDNLQLSVGESNGSNLAVFIPKNMKPGTYVLTVSIRSYRSQSIKVQVKAPDK